MQVKVNIYITAAGATRAFLIRDEEGSFPEVVGVGRSLPAAVADYAACFNERRVLFAENRLPEAERTRLSPSDVLPSRRMVQRFPDIWHLIGCKCGE